MSRNSMTNLFAEFTANGSVSEANSGTLIEIAVSSIYRSALQYRKYYDVKEIEAIGRSLQEKQLQPILVRPRNGAYEIVFGQKRWLGCVAVGKPSILAVVEELTDEEVMAIALTENMQRSNPNPVEEAQGLLNLIKLKTGLDQAAIVKLLKQQSRVGESGHNVVPTPEWEAIVAILKSYNLTPATFRVHRLPLLSLPEDVLRSLEQGKIEYTKALAIARIKDDADRAQLLAEAEAGLTLQEIKERIKPVEVEPDAIASRVKTLAPKLKKFQAKDNPSKAKAIDELLAQIEELLS